MKKRENSSSINRVVPSSNFHSVNQNVAMNVDRDLSLSEKEQQFDTLDIDRDATTTQLNISDERHDDICLIALHLMNC